MDRTDAPRSRRSVWPDFRRGGACLVAVECVMAWVRGLALGAAWIGLVLAVGCGGNTSSGSGGTGGTGAGGTAGVGGNCGAGATTCAQPRDCVLTATSCCVCSQPDLSDFMAVNTTHVQACACQGPPCGCMVPPNPYLGATCSSGKCVGFDVQQIDALSACNVDADCRLRIGIACCQSCQADAYNLVALRNDADPALQKLACDTDTPMACPHCMPVFPSDKRAACVQGRCQVVNK